MFSFVFSFFHRSNKVIYCTAYPFAIVSTDEEREKKQLPKQSVLQCDIVRGCCGIPVMFPLLDAFILIGRKILRRASDYRLVVSLRRCGLINRKDGVCTGQAVRRGCQGNVAMHVHTPPRRCHAVSSPCSSSYVLKAASQSINRPSISRSTLNQYVTKNRLPELYFAWLD